MLKDSWTVAWKEWKEMLLQLRGARLEALSFILALGFLGVVPALEAGMGWLGSPLVLIFAAWVPLIPASSVVADSFAGERERHTLEGLLATRLPDTSILLGKTVACTGYAWGFTLLMLAISLATVNITVQADSLLLFSPQVMIGAASCSFLSSAVTSCAGVLVSLRAPSVRYAQQFLGSTSILVFLAIYAAMRAIPIAWLAASSDAFLARLTTVIVSFLGPLLVVIFLLARVRFRRNRLVLD